MEFDLINEITKNYAKLEGASVVIGGWIRTIRTSKNVGFIDVNDGSCFKNVQVIFDKDLPNYSEAEKLTTGSTIVVEGEVVLTPNSKQPYEIKANKINIEGKCDISYPLQKKKHSFEYLRTIAHLRPRTNTFSAVFRVRSILTHAIQLFLYQRGFVYITTPCITTSDCEGAGEAFRISTFDFANVPMNTDKTVDYSKDFFGKEAFMTVSGQLNVEPFCTAFRNVYTFGPSFRAENSNTSRHVAEFWQVEPEMAFADLKDMIQVVEDMTKFIIKFVLDNAPEELEFFDKFIEKGLIEKLTRIVESDFASITYTEAIDILLKSGKEFEIPVKWGGGIQTEYERYLADEVYKRPVFVTDYPKESKAFYMRLNDDDKTVAATDLLFPGLGEIVGASQREERYDVLVQRIKELGLEVEDYDWYLELRKFGTCVHSGFGLGVERMIQFITGMENIRDVVPYPRAPKSAEF